MHQMTDLALAFKPTPDSPDISLPNTADRMSPDCFTAQAEGRLWRKPATEDSLGCTDLQLQVRIIEVISHAGVLETTTAHAQHL
jgi:hypothetical protein